MLTRSVCALFCKAGIYGSGYSRNQRTVVLRLLYDDGNFGSGRSFYRALALAADYCVQKSYRQYQKIKYYEDQHQSYQSDFKSQ